MPRILSAAILFTALASTNVALADVDVTFDELPEAVRKTVEREIKNGTIEEIERDDDHDRIVYEVEFVLDGLKYELDVAEDGTLLRRHRD